MRGRVQVCSRRPYARRDAQTEDAVFPLVASFLFPGVSQESNEGICGPRPNREQVESVDRWWLVAAFIVRFISMSCEGGKRGGSLYVATS